MKVIRENPKSVSALKTVFTNNIPKWILHVENDVLELLKNNEEDQFASPMEITITVTSDEHNNNNENWDWETNQNDTNINDNLIEFHAPLSPIDSAEEEPEVAAGSPPQQPKSPVYRTDPVALAELPFKLRKWTGIPPKSAGHTPSTSKTYQSEGRKRVRPKRPPGEPRKRKKLSPIRKSYQNKRRMFNQRQRKKLEREKRKAAQKQLEVQVPPPTSTLEGRMCNVSRISRHLPSHQQHHHRHRRYHHH